MNSASDRLAAAINTARDDIRREAMAAGITGNDGPDRRRIRNAGRRWTARLARLEGEMITVRLNHGIPITRLGMNEDEINTAIASDPDRFYAVPDRHRHLESVGFRTN